MPTRIVPWSDPPAMDSAAPMPVVRHDGNDLVVAYECRNPVFPGWDSGVDINHPGFELYGAVLRFAEITWYSFGGPGDERLHSHRFYPLGLRAYGFWEVFESPQVPTGSALQHWIITFHDETLEVVGSSAMVVSRREEGEDTRAMALRFAKSSGSENDKEMKS